MSALVFAAALLVAPASAGRCPQWGEARQVGALDPALLPEASGLAVSGKWERLYHHNDSGGGPWFFISDMAGGGLKRVYVERFFPWDTEDASLGPCGNATCLFLGDTGDNAAHREDFSIALVEERKDFPPRVKPLKVLRLRYPDGAHNAEALAVHPNGDLFIVTKETPRKKGAKPAKVFRLAKSKVMGKADGVQTMEPWGEIDVPAINKDKDKFGGIVTAMDIAPDGKGFLLLTYHNVLEFGLDLSDGPVPESLDEGKDFSRVPLKDLIQQESIAYLPDASGFLYGTEFVPKKAPEQKAPEIFLVPCLAPAPPGR
ncbi:MAG: hypothetical protein HZB91_09360 [Elusimicrobia bacterium]|nr:hypothetical protein [Elusimicrobiota bacterium]